MWGGVCVPGAAFAGPPSHTAGAGPCKTPSGAVPLAGREHTHGTGFSWPPVIVSHAFWVAETRPNKRGDLGPPSRHGKGQLWFWVCWQSMCGREMLVGRPDWGRYPPMIFHSVWGTRGPRGTCTSHGVRSPQSPAGGCHSIRTRGRGCSQTWVPHRTWKSIKWCSALPGVRRTGLQTPLWSLPSLGQGDVVRKGPGARERGTRPWLSSPLRGGLCRPHGGGGRMLPGVAAATWQDHVTVQSVRAALHV